MHEDMAFAQTALALAKKSYFVDEPLYHHRIRSDGGALSSNANQDAKYECLFMALEEIVNNLKRAGHWEVYETAFINYALQQCQWKYYRVSDGARQLVLDSLKKKWLWRLRLTEYSEDRFAVRDSYLFMRAVIEGDTPSEVEELLMGEQLVMPVEQQAAKADGGGTAIGRGLLRKIVDAVRGVGK